LKPYIMVFVSDMGRSVTFYKEALGLKLRSESPEWTEFDAGDAIVALHGGGAERETQKGSETVYAGTCALGFYVKDLDKSFRELRSKGVTFTMRPSVRRGEGIKLAVCLDPDGLPISLSQTVKS
jgi:lactoylglutathione lyase